MGAGQSGGVEIAGSSMGYQVLRVYPNSPGSQAGLKAYFDFIIAVGNTRFNKENGSLREILKASVDQKLKMIVFNTRTKRTREVEIVPSTSWGGNGLLGVSIKHSSFDRADERVWHVVDIEPGSPAYQAGFKANEDYVIGSDSILQENDDLYNLIEAHEGKALKLFVYNVNHDNCREVICHPNSRWGGKGFLGCEFGHGLLHRIPYVDNFDERAGDTSQVQSKNEQPVSAMQPQQIINNPMTVQGSMIQQQMQQLRNPTHPGHQLFQQALLDQTNSPQPQQPTKASEVLAPPPQLPHTFAQLASAQYQAPQHQVPPNQVPQHYLAPQHQVPSNQEPQHYLAPQHQVPPNQEPQHYLAPQHQVPPNQEPQHYLAPQHQVPSSQEPQHYQAPQNQVPQQYLAPQHQISTSQMPQHYQTPQQYQAPPQATNQTDMSQFLTSSHGPQDGVQPSI